MNLQHQFVLLVKGGVSFSNTSVPGSEKFNTSQTLLRVESKVLNKTRQSLFLNSSELQIHRIAATAQLGWHTGSNTVQKVVINAVNSSTVDCYIENIESANIKDIFRPIDTFNPPFPIISKHPRLIKGIFHTRKPIQTNKFYTNFLLGDQKLPIYIFPYALAWTGCAPESIENCHKGIGIWHNERDNMMFGGGDPVEYFYGPNHIHHITLSANELENSSPSKLSVQEASAFSIVVDLSTLDGKNQVQRRVLELPLVQGMGFVIMRYHNATPIISTFVGFEDFVHAGRKREDGTDKFLARLIDGALWILYVIPDDLKAKFKIVKKDINTYVADSFFTGIIQIAKLPNQFAAIGTYDKFYGVYAVGANVSGSVVNNHGFYTISWTTSGLPDRELLSFLLPHHIESLNEEGKRRIFPGLSLYTPSKGMATAFTGSNVTFIENEIPSAISFLPGFPDRKRNYKFCGSNSTTRALFSTLASNEINEDLTGKMFNQNSIYWSGKVSWIPNI
jgi:endo-1,3(4)-beta-glucanase